jgi:hypothetical protein
MLVATFALPVVVGTGLFWSGWRPQKLGNHGELIQPPRPMPEAGLLQPDGRPLPISELHGKWLLVMSMSGSCGVSCRQSLQQMSQVHLALNKEKSRLRRVFIGTGPMVTKDSSALAELRQLFPDIAVATIDSKAETAWSSALEGSGQAVFLADPLGNLILRYDVPTDMRGMLKDLERLLKYSWIH